MNTLNDFLRRAITGSVGVLNAMAGAIIILAAAGLLRPIDARWSGLSFGFDPAGLPFLSVVGWVGLGSALFLAGILLVVLAVRRTKKSAALASSPAAGQVAMSTQSLETLVQLEGERLAGVRSISPHIVLKKQEWLVECDVYLQPGVEKEARTAIREQLRTAVERHTGRPVAKMDVRFAEAPVAAPAERVPTPA